MAISFEELLSNPQYMKGLAVECVKRRLEYGATDESLSKISGVSLEVIEKFEKDAEIDVGNLLKLLHALNTVLPDIH